MTDNREDQLLQAVLKRTTVDRAFRQELLIDPHRAIAQAFGITIPADYRVRFIERPGDVDALMVLPDFDAAAEHTADELSDDQLEHIAGGTEMRWSE